MKINDVEKRTGLTAKSIRFYEQKGLLSVDRNGENDYREYTEDNVRRLLEIKLLRSLEFSVQEIQAFFATDNDAAVKMLEDKCISYSEQCDNLEQKRNYCRAVYKDYQKNGKLDTDILDTIDFLESDEIKELRDVSTRTNEPYTTILGVLCLLTPVVYFFIELHDGVRDGIMLMAAFAILCSICTFVILRNFFENRKKYREKPKKISFAWREALLLGMFYLVYIAGIVTINGVITPDNWLFRQTEDLTPGLFVLIPLVAESLWKITSAGEKKLNLLSGIVIALFAVSIYALGIQETCVTEDEIIYHSFMHPAGIAYSYDEVTSVEAGFSGKAVPLKNAEEAGEFYYTVYAEDSKAVFNVPDINSNVERYSEVWALCFEEFDQKLMDLGVDKVSSEENAELCDYAQQYKDIFLRIIRNKS